MGQRLNKIHIIQRELPGFRCINAHSPQQIAPDNDWHREYGRDSFFLSFCRILDPGIIHDVIYGHGPILQRSGIGPGEALSAAGVPVAVDLPGVGANLQDHLEVYFQYRCTQPITLNGRLGPLSKALIGARWVLRRDGLGATNHFESCAFIRSDRGVRWPDIQYHFLPGAMRYDGRAAFDGHGFQVHVGPNKPRSRGRVLIRSADPREPPSILFNYLTAARDIEDWRREGGRVVVSYRASARWSRPHRSNPRASSLMTPCRWCSSTVAEKGVRSCTNMASISECVHFVRAHQRQCLGYHHSS